MKFNITRHRKTWIAISGGLVAASLAMVGIFGFNLGLDFLGGLRLNIQFNTESPVAVEQLTEFFGNSELLKKDAIVQSSGDNSFLITLEELSESKFETLSTNLKNKISTFEVISFRRVSNSIGQHFQQEALIAIGLALIAIVLFVAIAFRKIPETINPWRFGGVAIIALFHDVLIIVGVFAVLGAVADVELNLQFITALLATLGFSVNDTIVILDRVRENLNKQKSKETFEDVIEKSVKQTLRRSINTSISTLFPLVFLLLFGADSIFYFMLALTIGIVVGTYSSIFIAAPLLVTWKNLVDHKKT
jgi:preprotein translocase subunit SecF